MVKVALLDTNDHDPKITFKVLPDQSQTFASVNELAKVGTSVAAITVTDADKGTFLIWFLFSSVVFSPKLEVVHTLRSLLNELNNPDKLDTKR